MFRPMGEWTSLRRSKVTPCCSRRLYIMMVLRRLPSTPMYRARVFSADSNAISS